MPTQDDELKARFQGLIRLPFSEELRQGVLEAARQQGAVRRSRIHLWRTTAASIGGVAAASVLVWGAWHYGTGVNPSSIHSTQTADRQVVSQSLADAPDYGLQLAPLTVGFVQGPPSAPGQSPTLYATLTNVGTRTIQPTDVIGVLSFSAGSNKNLLGKTDWISFVNSTDNQPIAPGDTISWKFRPIGAPQLQGQFTDRPKLVFVRRGLVQPEQADVVWHKAPLQVAELGVLLKNTFPTGESVTLTARVSNRSTKPVALSDLLAIVWFSDTSGNDWTTTGTLRFMTHVTANSREAVFAPGASAVVSFDLVGPKSFHHSTPHLSLIWQ